MNVLQVVCSLCLCEVVALLTDRDDFCQSGLLEQDWFVSARFWVGFKSGSRCGDTSLPPHADGGSALPSRLVRDSPPHYWQHSESLVEDHRDDSSTSQCHAERGMHADRTMDNRVGLEHPIVPQTDHGVHCCKFVQRSVRPPGSQAM